MYEKSLSCAKSSIKIEAQSVAAAAAALDWGAFARAVDLLAKAPRIVTCASGTSGIAAKKAAHSFCCIARPAFYIPPSEMLHGALGSLKPQDCLLLISRGGKTAELLPIIEFARQKDVRLIAITENPSSPLGTSADVVLKMSIEKESDPLSIMATSSFIVSIAIIDALLAALIEETGYRLEDFGPIHPGGAVGALLAKAPSAFSK